jgi:DNA polymerase-3 subunit delta
MTSSIYDLAKAVIANRLDIGMSILGELFYKKEEPVIILSALSGAFCDLYRAKVATLSGVADSFIIADFNYRGREFRIRNALRDCRNVDVIFLSSCLTLLMKADARIKSTRVSKRLVLEQLIVEISRVGRR